MEDLEELHRQKEMFEKWLREVEYDLLFLSDPMDIKIMEGYRHLVEKMHLYVIMCLLAT